MNTLVARSDVIIFDFDGTLYEGTEHFDYYAKILVEDLPQEEQRAFLQEYEDMKNGDHIVAIGKAYDVHRDAILTMDSMTLEVIEVHEWNGQAWPLKQVHRTYPSPIAFDFENLIAIGDGWWLPYVAAAHYQATENGYEKYVRTKDYMASNDFHLAQTPGLRAWLLQLKKEKQLVLMTNSEQDDVERLLTELKLDDIFDDKRYSAMKPMETEAGFRSILTKYGKRPEQVCSIGDNYINEIAPALKIGMNAVYIHPHRRESSHERLAIVHSLARKG